MRESLLFIASIYEGRVSGPSYDQGSTLKALNFFRLFDLLIAHLLRENMKPILLISTG